MRYSVFTEYLIFVFKCESKFSIYLLELTQSNEYEIEFPLSESLNLRFSYSNLLNRMNMR